LFACEAKTLAEARAKRDASHLKNGYNIENREIKVEKFDGRKV
jgi:hypothetical protein